MPNPTTFRYQKSCICINISFQNERVGSLQILGQQVETSFHGANFLKVFRSCCTNAHPAVQIRSPGNVTIPFSSREISLMSSLPKSSVSLRETHSAPFHSQLSAVIIRIAGAASLTLGLLLFSPSNTGLGSFLNANSDGLSFINFPRPSEWES